MKRIRARIVAFAIAVLVCQAGAMTAAPVALCRGALSIEHNPHPVCLVHAETSAAAGVSAAPCLDPRRCAFAGLKPCATQQQDRGLT